jgi:hypothetical protein
MISKLLQKLTYGVNQSREVVDGQHENDSSSPGQTELVKNKGHNLPCRGERAGLVEPCFLIQHYRSN